MLNIFCACNQLTSNDAYLRFMLFPVLHADAGRFEDISRYKRVLILSPMAESKSCDTELYGPGSSVLQ